MASFGEAMEGVARGEAWTIQYDVGDLGIWHLQRVWQEDIEDWKVYYANQQEVGRLVKLIPYCPSVRDIEANWVRRCE